MQRNKIKNLLKRYSAGDCTEQEKALVESWYLQCEDDSIPDLRNDERNIDLNKILLSLPASAVKVRKLWQLPQIAAAAAAILILIIGTYFYTLKENGSLLVESEVQKILPGRNKATLTLADGSRIILDDIKNGILVNQAGLKIVKVQGKIKYAISEPPVGAALDEAKRTFHTIETPAGGNYEVILPDGSTVILNSSSSLRFPTNFMKEVREVNLTGEAFFDIAKNKDIPFIVTAKDQVVEVLGTKFNINSYSEEENIKTTLIEGSVKILYKDKVVFLKAGEQFEPKNAVAKVVKADTEQVIAWKNGYFLFKDENIENIMREISRWYDVEVEYAGDIPTVQFGGNISRYTDIADVLRVLEFTNAVHFKIEGRRITVMP